MSKGTNNKHKSVKYELIGVGLLTLAAFGLVSLFWDGGTVGKFIGRFLKLMAGEGAILVPAVVGFYGWKMIKERKKPQLNAQTYGLIFAMVLILTGLHLTIQPSKFLDDGFHGMGGGSIGGIVAFVLYKAFGMAGTYIILLAGFLSVLIVVANVSLATGASSMGKSFVAAVGKLRQDLSNFFFTVVEEKEEVEPPAEAGFKGPIIVDHASEAEPKPSAKGKGLAERAREVVDTVFPKVQVYPEAWSETGPHREEELDLDLDAPMKDLGEITDLNPATAPKQDEAQLQSAAGQMDVEPGYQGGYQLPALELLSQPLRIKSTRMNKDITDNVRVLEETLDNFNVNAKVTQVSRGPAITRYELQPAPGVKVSRIVNLADDIALSMAAPDVRIEAPIPGKAAIGIEVPNKETAMVYLRELLESPEFMKANSFLSVALGKDISGTPIIADLSKMPHLLIAGSTGSGKSVCMNALIASILFKASPDQVKFLMIDPKMVELTTFNGIPHLIAPVVTDPKKAATALRWVVSEMENRYQLFAGTGVKNITGYNALRKKAGEPELPLVVVLIDELADLMMVAPADIEDAVCRLAQMARAAGIHLVVATQRPSVDVITGLIKANIPSRIAFAVSSQVDSRTILDIGGAEKLLGKGDMLFFPVGAAKPLRVQGVFVSEKEIEDLVGFLKGQGKPEYEDGVLKVEVEKNEGQQVEEDELLPQALQIIIESGQASISMLQRRLRIGYTRAARLMDIMEERGFVGGYEGSKPRNVLITIEKYRALFEPKD